MARDRRVGPGGGLYANTDSRKLERAKGCAGLFRPPLQVSDRVLAHTEIAVNSRIAECHSWHFPWASPMGVLRAQAIAWAFAQQSQESPTPVRAQPYAAQLPMAY